MAASVSPYYEIMHFDDDDGGVDGGGSDGCDGGGCGRDDDDIWVIYLSHMGHTWCIWCISFLNKHSRLYLRCHTAWAIKCSPCVSLGLGH